MRILRWIAVAALLHVIAASTDTALAQPAIDGTAEAAYGTALSTQNTNTQFGDNESPDLIATSGGSEIDQVFGVIANDGTEDRLYVTIAGNLEGNFNKMEVFLDVDGDAGGVNEIDGSALPIGVDAFCCGGFGTTGGALQQPAVSGLVFDSGFNADHYLTFSNGSEEIGGANFWAINAHYADLTQGTNGRVVSAGIQLAPQGLPNVLRAPNTADFDDDFDVDGTNFLTWQRGVAAGTTRAEGDTNTDEVVDAADLTAWQDQYATDRDLDNDFFVPFNGGLSSADLILLPALAGLSQGQLIDKNYALSADGGCTAATDDGGAGCVARELEFVLPVDSNDVDNALNHRDFENTVDLQLAFDNSNVAGVSGDGPYETETTGDPENVVTGLEFSIPLDELGLPSTGFVGEIRLTAYVNGGTHNFASNQFAGDGILTGNLGAFDLLGHDLDFDTEGDQFVTISNVPAISAVPEPTAALLLFSAATTLLGVARRR